MTTKQTEVFWDDREAFHGDNHELKRTLIEFAMERESAGEPILAGTLRAAASRIAAVRAPVAEVIA